MSQAAAAHRSLRARPAVSLLRCSAAYIFKKLFREKKFVLHLQTTKRRRQNGQKHRPFFSTVFLKFLKTNSLSILPCRQHRGFPRGGCTACRAARPRPCGGGLGAGRGRGRGKGGEDSWTRDLVVVFILLSLTPCRCKTPAVRCTSPGDTATVDIIVICDPCLSEVFLFSHLFASLFSVLWYEVTEKCQKTANYWRVRVLMFR